MTVASSRPRPLTAVESSSTSRNSELRAVSLGMAALYALLVPAHLMVLTGAVSASMAALAASSSLLCAALAGRSSPGRPALPPAVTEGVVLIPLVNSLAHLALTRQVQQTTTLALVIVGLGAYLISRRFAIVLTGVTLLTWVGLLALVLRPPADRALHFGFLLFMATSLGAVLHQVRRRRELAAVQAAHALAESERRFRTVFDASPAGAGLADEDGLFVAVNPALCTLFARPAEELIGQTSLAFTHPDDRPSHPRGEALVDRPADGILKVEKRYVRPGGEIRWARLTVTEVEGPAGRPWRLAHVQDVTERRAAENALRDSEANLLAVARVVRAIRTGEDPRTVIVHAVRELAGTSAVCLLERDHEGGMRVTAADGAPIVGARVGRGASSAAGHVWRTAQPLFLADPHRDPRVSSELLEITQARSALWQPVAVRGEVRAVLVLLWSERTERVPERADMAITMLTNETAVALEHDALLARLEREAVTDPLTGLRNRRAWDEDLHALLAAAGESGRPLTVAVADLDRFKLYNDAYGHLAGDDLLQRFAAQARSAVRETDVLARWGGEEFTVALPDCDAAAAHEVLERLRTAVPDGESTSVGLAVWDGVESGQALLGRADAALYEAKLAGRDCIRDAVDTPVRHPIGVA